MTDTVQQVSWSVVVPRLLGTTCQENAIRKGPVDYTFFTTLSWTIPSCNQNDTWLYGNFFYWADTLPGANY